MIVSRKNAANSLLSSIKKYRPEESFYTERIPHSIAYLVLVDYIFCLKIYLNILLLVSLTVTGVVC